MAHSTVRKLFNIASIGDVNYWAIPKCGNTSIKAFLLHRYLRLDISSLNPSESNNFVHKEGVGFCYLTPQKALENGRHNITFVRDPTERFKSLYADFCTRRSNPGLPGFFGMTVDACLAEIEQQFAKNNEKDINPHLRSQSYYLRDFKGSIFQISDFKNIRINLTRGRVLFTEDQLNRIQIIYSGDRQLLERTTPIERFFELVDG